MVRLSAVQVVAVQLLLHSTTTVAVQPSGYVSPLWGNLPKGQRKDERSVSVTFDPPFGARPMMAKPSFFGVASYSAPISGRLMYASPNTRDGCRPRRPAAGARVAGGRGGRADGGPR